MQKNKTNFDKNMVTVLILPEGDTEGKVLCTGLLGPGLGPVDLLTARTSQHRLFFNRSFGLFSL